MSFVDSFKKSLLTIDSNSFPSACLEVFHYQFHECSIYHKYCNLIGKNPSNVKRVDQIPFLPIEFFKNHAIKSGKWAEEKTFKSSGTTGMTRSNHHIRELDFYHSVAKKHFEDEVIELTPDVSFLALLPSYQEQEDSSLIEMVDHFMGFSNKESGYFLQNEAQLSSNLKKSSNKVLIGVAFALLDLADKFNEESIVNTIVIETGGMKGRKKEITRKELHDRLKEAFKIETVYSEYGMTELLSQAYGANGLFQFPKWAYVLIRDINDPFCYLDDGKTGGINVIDLANIDSCAFLETKDLGKKENGTFEVLGRFDNSDVRGCNLMI